MRLDREEENEREAMEIQNKEKEREREGAIRQNGKHTQITRKTGRERRDSRGLKDKADVILSLLFSTNLAKNQQSHILSCNTL